MSRFCLLILLTLVVSKASGQVSFTEGYYIINSDTLSGFVEERESYLNDKLKFRKKMDGETTSYLKTSVSVIYLSSLNQLYIKRTVDIDKKPFKVGELEENFSKKIVTETVFLKYLVQGKIDLLRYADEDSRVHYFYKNKQEIKELNQVRFKDKNGRMIEFPEYKQQIKNLFSDCVNQNLEPTSFSQKELEKIFIKYNECGGQNVSQKKKSTSKTSLSIVTGFSNNRLSYEGSDYVGLIAQIPNYTPTTNYLIGIALNFSKRKASPLGLSLELLIKNAGQYVASPQDPIILRTYDVNMNFTYSNLNTNFQYSFLRNSKIVPYLKGGIGVSYLLNSTSRIRYPDLLSRTITVEPLTNFSNLNYNLLGAVGISVNRFHAEARFTLNPFAVKNDISTATTSSIATIRSFDFLVCYRLL